MDRNDRFRLMVRAEARERRTKLSGARNGVFGQHGLTILRVIAFKFLNIARNKAWPSYKTIMAATGFCREVVARGIKSLEAEGFLLVTRRPAWRDGRPQRETNVYSLPENPPPLPDDYESLLGREKPPVQDSLPFDQWESPLKDALVRLGKTYGLEVNPAQ